MNPQDPSQKLPDAGQATPPEQPVTSPEGQTAAPQEPVVGTGEGFYNPNPDDTTYAPAADQSPGDGLKQSVEQPAPPEEDEGPDISWTASEFIHHDKAPQWYIILAGVTAVLAIVAWLITKDFIAVGAPIFGAIIFAVAASRHPREQHFAVGKKGVAIGNRLYPYSDFRSFAIIEEDAVRSIVFMPLKRFMPMMTILYDPADEKTITDSISAHLPVNDHKLDALETLMRKIRF